MRTERLPELATRLRLAVGRLHRRLRQEGGSPIGASSFSALASIERVGRVRLGELAEIEGVKPPTMSGIAAALEEAGLITREVGECDRRQVRVSTTAAGRALLEQARTRKTAFLASRLKRLSPSELDLLDQAVALLERMREDDR